MKTERPGIVVRFDLLESIDMLTDEECGRLFKAMLQYGSTGEVPDFTGNEKFLWPSVRKSIDLDLEGYDRKVKDNQLKGQYGAYLRKAQLEKQVALSYSDWREQQIEKKENKESCGVEPNATHTLSIGQPKEANTNTNTNTNTSTNTNSHSHFELTSSQGEKECVRKREERERESMREEGEGEGGKNFTTRKTDWQQGELNQAFETFWQAYPKKVKKEDAQLEFYKAMKSGIVTLDEMLTAIEGQKLTWQWTHDEGHWIPNPRTWLMNHRWEDELDYDTQLRYDAMQAEKKRNEKSLEQMAKLQKQMEASITPEEK